MPGQEARDSGAREHQQAGATREKLVAAGGGGDARERDDHEGRV